MWSIYCGSICEFIVNVCIKHNHYYGHQNSTFCWNSETTSCLLTTIAINNNNNNYFHSYKIPCVHLFLVHSFTRFFFIIYMYKLIEWLNELTMSTDAYSLSNDMATNFHAMNNINSIVNKKRHTKYFQRCLDVLPPRLASHDSTR